MHERVPEHGDSHASSSHEPSSEPQRREVLGYHSVLTHLPKFTRLPCRRRTGEDVPRAGKFGDLITADNKILEEESESRNNHRYAVVVQDLATQWILSYSCKTKTSHETERILQKFSEPN